MEVELKLDAQEDRGEQQWGEGGEVEQSAPTAILSLSTPITSDLVKLKL